MNLEIHTIDYHRNGIAGEGFYIVHFTDRDEPEYGKLMAVVFPPDETDEEGETIWEFSIRADEWTPPRVAVFQEDKLPNTKFGQNSMRGDNYANDLYQAIREDR